MQCQLQLADTNIYQQILTKLIKSNASYTGMLLHTFANILVKKLFGKNLVGRFPCFPY